ncbi:hypothetical protein B0T25DRAFT_565483 [Lasiosphaeria hispida]|uniref:Berberine/berberine-like domain-containing protein n=1 Tax=Lasiosphaeria hispida TaxID=260671 RepID=A0AAJ0MIS9_9PEZI|nr:hypothetical protein B0T25DRAFT_565483 [Lasiosphaeria hispida]
MELQIQLKRRVLPEKPTRFLYATLVAQGLRKRSARTRQTRRTSSTVPSSSPTRPPPRFLASVKKKLRLLSLNGEAAFVNFPDRDFPTKFYERAYFGDNKDELRRVKQVWDPDGFFRWIQAVRRPGDPDEDDDGGEDEDRTDKLASEQWTNHQWTRYEVEDLESMISMIWRIWAMARTSRNEGRAKEAVEIRTGASPRGWFRGMSTRDFRQRRLS